MWIWPLTLLLMIGVALAPLGAHGQKITIKSKDCRRLVRHAPSSDVAFKPGVDVRGKKVIGADLYGPSSIKLPDVIEFDITRNIRDFLGGPEADAEAATAAATAAASGTAADAAAATAAQKAATRVPSGTMNLGRVRFNINSGALTFNGKPLTDPQREILLLECQNAMKPGN